MTLSQLDLELIEYSDNTLKVWTIFTNIHNDICVIIAIDNETQCWYDEFWWPSRCCWDPYSVWILYTVLGWDTAFEWCTGIIKKIYGSPFWWGRVCMLENLYSWSNWNKKITTLSVHFDKNPELYDMDCLSWDDETKKLVLEFLNSLSINK